MKPNKTTETVMCDYYTKTNEGLKQEYGEVNQSDLSEVKGFDLPVHKNLNKLLTKK
jgi:hypothetical protein